ncbi:protein mono-ADP-ribosyltransferase PARP14 [Chanos chanos]|uniref:Poly [ADP-ribose] polymerase n=1 Tax=Chanos chanos TaxID=29144 RepID=A0A6J2WI31_CHACN|nr:protein mono-ADP-ribosyltransferase PARP14-like [Chanos chanos]
MDEKTLVLEGLPDHLDHVRTKLELYFRNKRKSGGEIKEVREHPEDTRKALLVYIDDGDLKRVLDKGIHKVDLKNKGLAELKVSQLEDGGPKAKKCKPALLPKPKLQKQQCNDRLPGLKHSEETDNRVDVLLVNSTTEIDNETLTLYFEQFTEDFEITKIGKNCWTVKLARQSDLQAILDRERHELGLSVRVYKQEGTWDPRRFILSGFKDSCKCEIISVFINSCSQSAPHTWETIDDEERIIVTFKKDIDVESFLRKCSSKKFKGMEIGASRLELTDSILVKGDMTRISEDALFLYFTNKKKSHGGDIKSLIWVNKHKSAVITFEDCNVAHQVVEKKHCPFNTELSTSLLYSGLQKALTGELRPLSAIPTDISIVVNEDLINFIKRNEQCKKLFQSQLKTIHANLLFDKATTSNEIVLGIAVDRQSLAAQRLSSTWESKARREAQSFLNNYCVSELAAEAEVWKKIEDDCQKLNSPDTDVFYHKSRSAIVVVGLTNTVNALFDLIRKHVDTATEELKLERNTIERSIQLNSLDELNLIEGLLHSKVTDVTVSKDEVSLSFHLKGLKDSVIVAEQVIQGLDKQPVNLSETMVTFLMSLHLKKFEQDYFAQNNISASFLKSKDSLQILAETEMIQKADLKLREVLKEDVIHLTPDQTAAVKSESWMSLIANIKDEMESSQNDHKVQITPSEAKIEVCGFSNVVADVSRKLKGYLENKTPATEDIPLKSVREVEFIDTCMNLSEIPEVKNLGVTILVCRTQNSPCLKVTAAKDKIKEAVEAVKKQLVSLIMETQTYSKAGQSKSLEKHEANLKAKAKEFQCKLYLSKQTGKTGIPKSFTHKVGSVTLTIIEGEIHHHVADALICPLNNNLAFNNPVAQEFLKVGGSQIKDVCDRRQNEKLLVGSVVLSNPGKLRAKTLIYALLPRWGLSGQPLDSRLLQLAIYDSLQKAEDKSCVSVAMPALGCCGFGFPVKQSYIAVKAAIEQFCRNHQNAPKNLRNIFVVESDVKIVDEFKSHMQQWGSTAATGTPAPSTSIISQASLAALTLKHGSDTKVTVHGVTVSLKNGDITKETVDVIVNSNSSTLDLNTGVSGAILKAAGKCVVEECKKHGPQKGDGVVMTGGGLLKCKHIAQMVGPQTAEDITSSIHKVLQLCEKEKTTTVAIPAIGTGRGGIDPKESIKAILTGLENHLLRSKSSSLKELRLVAFEQRIFDSYRDYLKERNKKSSHNTLPPNQVKIGGVRVEVKKGDITTETVRGIVNTTNRDMNLKGGVSGAIFRAAGNSVELECQKHGPLQGDTAAVTSGGNLQCDFIIHMAGPHSAAEARSRVKKVLERCEENKITTVSLPAVGTGGGKVKNAEAISAMLQGFDDHLSHRLSTEIKLIYVVIDRDEVLQEFLQGLKQWTLNVQSKDEEEEEGVTNTTEAMIGPLKVKVLCGDITKETTEAIVSSTNTTLNLSTGVSGAILKAAGQTVVDECSALGTQPDDGVVLTKAGNLPTKNIIHMVGQTTEINITKCMYKVMQKCEENKITSVSFPALGTGAGNLAAAAVARAMIDAIANFSIDSPKSLNNVHIVIFQANMRCDFEDALKKFKRIIPKPSIAGAHKPTKQAQSQPSNTKAKLCLATETAAISFPIMAVEIYGSSSADIAKVKQYIDDLISEECTSKYVNSKHLANLPEADKEAIVALSQTNQVHILVAAQDKLTVSGKKDDVLDAVLKINVFTQKAQQQEFQESEEKRIRETLRWEVGAIEAWKPLDSSISYQLELAYHRREPKHTYQYKGKTYTVDFKEMMRTDSGGNQSRVKRTLLADSDTAIIQPPPTWTKMDGKDLKIIILPSTSKEYQKIEKHFLASSKNPQDPKNVQVVQISRIQSQGQWQRYAVLKQTLDKKYPNQENEKILYHGTTKDICEKINKNGFNRSFCGRNATYYGDGTYFAKESWYSCQDTYSNPDGSGLKYMYRARVLTGSPCLGKQGMKEPDPLDPNNPRAGLHDCAVDNLQQPFIYVVFVDAGAYPDYLISFKTS